MQFFCASEGCSDVEDIKDSGIRVLVAQCLSLMGVAKLQEATATKNAGDGLKQRLVTLISKLTSTDSKTTEYSRIEKKIKETQ